MTPVGHTIVGIWIGTSIEKKNSIKYLLFYTIIASLPDFDIVFGFILWGKTGVNIHQLYTHNLSFVLIITLLTFFLSKKDKKITLFVFFALLSHLILDLFVIDKKPPIGIMLFFPFSLKLFNIPILSGVNKSSFKALFSLHNLKAVIVEIIILSPLWGYTIKKILRKRDDSR